MIDLDLYIFIFFFCRLSWNGEFNLYLRNIEDEVFDNFVLKLYFIGELKNILVIIIRERLI